MKKKLTCAACKKFESTKWTDAINYDDNDHLNQEIDIQVQTAGYT